MGGAPGIGGPLPDFDSILGRGARSQMREGATMVLCGTTDHAERALVLTSMYYNTMPAMKKHQESSLNSSNNARISAVGDMHKVL